MTAMITEIPLGARLNRYGRGARNRALVYVDGELQYEVGLHRKEHAPYYNPKLRELRAAVLNKRMPEYSRKHEVGGFEPAPYDEAVEAAY